MLKTETELKETWCPFTGPFNVQSAKCIGLKCSQCVDIGPVMETRRVNNVGPTLEDNQPEGDGWTPVEQYDAVTVWRRQTGELYVYCGRNVGQAMAHQTNVLLEALNQLKQSVDDISYVPPQPPRF